MKSKKDLSSRDWGAFFSWGVMVALAMGIVIYSYSSLLLVKKNYQEPMQWDASQGKRH